MQIHQLHSSAVHHTVRTALGETGCPCDRRKANGIWFATTLLLLALTACGNKEDKAGTPQIAAKVGSQEISIQQINQVLSRTNSASAAPAVAQALRRDVLEKLIDQQLAVDQAVENKLDRSPDVVAQIEAARREVLARAYIQHLAAALPKPKAEEARKYFTEHPQLFSERRVYNLQEILVPAAAGAAVAEQLRAQVAAGKSMEEIAAFLKSREIKFGGGAAQRAAEQIPLELLAKVHALKDGQTAIIDSAQGFTVLRVVSSQSAPVPEANALPRIEQFLANQRSAEAVSRNLKDLRAKTSITYMTDFAPAVAAASAPASDAKTKNTMEQGATGLK